MILGRKKGITRHICSKCNNKVENKSKRYCNSCSASYLREWRKNHPQTEIQKFKSSVRRKTNMRISRGLLFREPCEICNNSKVEAHHDDYKKPYVIRWLCKKHHREHHKNNPVNRMT